MMLSDLVGWLLYSPRRLALAAVPALVVTGVGIATVSGTEDGPTERHETASHSAQPAAVHQAPASTPVSTERSTTSQGMLQTARRFAGAYVIPRGAIVSRHISARLRRLATPALWRGLELAAPSSLPRGTVEHLSVEVRGAFSGLVTADLDKGDQISMTVVAWQQGWRVSDVRSGDAG